MSHLHLHYRVALDGPGLWRFDAGERVVIARARLSDVGRVFDLAIPVARSRMPGRRILSADGTGESFSIEPDRSDADELARARVYLHDAPEVVARFLREME